jgi:hypothetical protein
VAGLWGFDFTLRLKFLLVEGLVESIYQSGLHSAESLIFCLIETEALLRNGLISVSISVFVSGIFKGLPLYSFDFLSMGVGFFRSSVLYISAAFVDR